MTRRLRPSRPQTQPQHLEIYVGHNRTGYVESVLSLALPLTNELEAIVSRMEPQNRAALAQHLAREVAAVVSKKSDYEWASLGTVVTSRAATRKAISTDRDIAQTPEGLRLAQLTEGAETNALGIPLWIDIDGICADTASEYHHQARNHLNDFNVVLNEYAMAQEIVYFLIAKNAAPNLVEFERVRMQRFHDRASDIFIKMDWSRPVELAELFDRVSIETPAHDHFAASLCVGVAALSRQMGAEKPVLGRCPTDGSVRATWWSDIMSPLLVAQTAKPCYGMVEVAQGWPMRPEDVAATISFLVNGAMDPARFAEPIARSRGGLSIVD